VTGNNNVNKGNFINNWNEYNFNPLTRNNWRTSLVPAPAVIPAPIAYIILAVVEKLVVELWGLCIRVCRDGKVLWCFLLM